MKAIHVITTLLTLSSVVTSSLYAVQGFNLLDENFWNSITSWDSIPDDTIPGVRSSGTVPGGDLAGFASAGNFFLNKTMTASTPVTLGTIQTYFTF